MVALELPAGVSSATQPISISFRSRFRFFRFFRFFGLVLVLFGFVIVFDLVLALSMLGEENHCQCALDVECSVRLLAGLLE